MDNVTHSLIGVLLARASLPWTRSLKGAVWAAVLASNAPDFDLLATPFFADGKLGYLVHHRGHTHTVVPALLLAVGCALVARRVDPAVKWRPLLVLSLLAGLLHVGADSWNSYGVHPFWPFANGWFYGDAIFILEPLLWLALLPLAWVTARGGWRVLLGVVAVGLFAATTVGLGAATAVGLAGVTAALTLVQRRWDSPALAAGLSLSVLAAFLVGSGRADAALRARHAAARPEERVLDVVRSPRPATPWCWQGIVLSRDTTTYHARTALVSLAPGLTTPAACAIRPVSVQTAPMVSSDLPDDAEVVWGPRFSAPWAELAGLAAAECRVDAVLHFLRAPFWVQEGDRLVTGDLRYDSEPGLGFAEIETTRAAPPDTRGCDYLPPWRSAAVLALLGGPE